jgi:hypothetical protein
MPSARLEAEPTLPPLLNFLVQLSPYPLPTLAGANVPPPKGMLTASRRLLPSDEDPSPKFGVPSLLGGGGGGGAGFPFDMIIYPF